MTIGHFIIMISDEAGYLFLPFPVNRLISRVEVNIVIKYFLKPICGILNAVYPG